MQFILLLRYKEIGELAKESKEMLNAGFISSHITCYFTIQFVTSSQIAWKPAPYWWKRGIEVLGLCWFLPRKYHFIKISISADSSDALYFRPVKDSVLWQKQTSCFGFGHDNIGLKYLMIRISVFRALVSRIYVNWAVHIYVIIYRRYFSASSKP